MQEVEAMRGSRKRRVLDYVRFLLCLLVFQHTITLLGPSCLDRIRGLAGLTFAEWAREQLEGLRGFNRAEDTLRLNGGVYEQFQRFVGDVPIDAITTPQVEAYLIERGKTTAPATVNRDWRILKALFNTAITYGHIKTNPVAKARQAAVIKDFPWVPSLGEIKLFLESARRPIACGRKGRTLLQPDQRIIDLIVLFANVGLRLKEARLLTWPCIDWQLAQISVRPIGHRIKGRRARKLQPIPEAVMDMLRRRQEGISSEFVFYTKSGKPMAGRNIERSFENIGDRCGVPIDPQSLRRAFATHNVASGAMSVAEVSQWLGHSSIAVTQAYIGNVLPARNVPMEVVS